MQLVTVLMFVSQVCDSLLNIGPCSCVDMGEPAFLSVSLSIFITKNLSLSLFHFCLPNGHLTEFCLSSFFMFFFVEIRKRYGVLLLKLN